MIVAVAGGYWLAGSEDAADGAETAVGVVRRGTLVVEIDEQGEVEAEKRIVISNDLQWPVIIDEAVEDGKLVQSGEVIIRFSCKELEDAIRKQELDVTSARSDYEQARANLELQKLEMSEKIRKAEQGLKDAQADRDRYLEGEWPVKKREYEREVEIQQEELAIAQSDLDFMTQAHRKLGDKSPYTDNELRSKHVSLDRKKLAVAKSVAQLKMLIEYDHPKEMRKLDNAVRDGELAMERARHDAELELSKGEETLRTRKERLGRHEEELARLQEEQEKLTVRAEREGLVVYDTGRRYRGDDVTIAQGEKISPRQQLMIIPDMTTLQVATKVYEAVSKDVKAGIPARIRLESRPGEVYEGNVKKISVLPDHSRRWWNPGVNVYPVIVTFNEDIDGLKPNMSAKVELELARLEDVLVAPVAAVFSEGDRSYCWVVGESGGRRRTEVEVGMFNDRDIHIISGLSEGDRVLLIEPETTGERQDRKDEPNDETMVGMPAG